MTTPRPGARNLVTDVAGLIVGNAEDERVRTGVTVLIPERPAVAAIDVRGGGPGTRESDALGPAGSVDVVHGLVLSGGSAFGLDAATGLQGWLAERGVGFQVGPVRVPIVPQAILFDLLNGGDKIWGERPPYQALARAAASAAGPEFAIGSAGAGYGATTATLRGGLGSASLVMPEGVTVGAIVAVNALGSATIGRSPYFWAGPLEIDAEAGGRGWPATGADDAHAPLLKGGRQENTTIAIVATDAVLDRRGCMRLAAMAQTGLARALWPVHAPLDGDVVFAISTGRRPLADPLADLTRIGAHAANTLARAVARGLYHAAPRPDDWPIPPSYRQLFLS